MHGLFPTPVQEAVLDVMTDHENLSLKALDSKASLNQFQRITLTMLKLSASLNEHLQASQ